jgi:hypothetical protein
MPAAVTAWTVPDAKEPAWLFDLNIPQPQPALSFTVMGHRGSRCHTTPDAPHICPALHANTSPAARPTILQQLQCKCCNNAPAPTGPLRPKSGLVVLHPQLQQPKTEQPGGVRKFQSLRYSIWMPGMNLLYMMPQCRPCYNSAY